MERNTVIEAVLQRDRVFVIAGLSVVNLSAWVWTLAGAGMPMRFSDGMAAMTGAMGSIAMTMASWSPSHAAMVVLMWWIMIVAMMLPSAAPLILLFTAIHRRRQGRCPYSAAGLITAGYVAVWAAFSLGAALAQWGLGRSGLVSSETMVAGSALAGGILLATGLYQITRRSCSSPNTGGRDRPARSGWGSRTGPIASVAAGF
jgi:predicted metal-binding membrane protein